MLLLSTTLWKLIPHLHTVSNYIPTTSLLLFFSAYISITVHWHKRSVNPSATTCMVWKFTQDVSVVSWTGRMWTPTAWSCFLNPSLNTTFLYLWKKYICAHSDTFTYTYSHSRSDNSRALWQISFFLSLAPFHIHFLASFPLSFFPRFPPGLSITQRRSNSCHHYV